MRRLAFALVAASGLSGCFNEFEEYRQTTPPSRPPGAEALPSAPPDAVFPLVPGTRYEYRARFGLGTSGPFTGGAVMSVVDGWKLADRRIAEVRMVATYFGRTRRDPYTFVRTGDRIGLFEKFPPDKVTFFMPTELSAGDTWKVETGEGTGDGSVEAVEAVTVPAGTYPGCWRVRYVNPGAKTDMTLWMAPSVGLVRADVAMQASMLPLRGRLELERVEWPVGTKGASPQPQRPSAHL